MILMIYDAIMHLILRTLIIMLVASQMHALKLRRTRSHVCLQRHLTAVRLAAAADLNTFNRYREVGFLASSMVGLQSLKTRSRGGDYGSD
jgi:hypothetical protein